jgi:ribose-phosphate pyrophosphokinase
MINKQTVIVGASGTASFGKHMGELLECPYIEAVSGKFPNEELKVTVPEAGETTILLGSLSHPVNTRVIEYLLMADAIKRMGCRHIVGALSWFAYSKQDKVFLPGEPLSAKVIATILQDVSLKELVTLELHNPSIAGYFDIPVTNVSATPIFITHFKQQDLSNTMVVSPDAGSIKNSTKVADSLGVPIAYAAKQRDLHTGKVTVTEINQSIENKDILIFDDMVASGSTLIEVAQFLKGRGARKISVCVTHHLYLDGVQEKLDNSPIDEFITTNSIEKPSTISSNKLKVLDIAPIMVAGLK